MRYERGVTLLLALLNLPRSQPLRHQAGRRRWRQSVWREGLSSSSKAWMTRYRQHQLFWSIVLPLTPRKLSHLSNSRRRSRWSLREIHFETWNKVIFAFWDKYIWLISYCQERAAAAAEHLQGGFDAKMAAIFPQVNFFEAHKISSQPKIPS